MNAKQLINYLQLIPSQISVFIRGRHGIGKSEIVKQFAELLGYELIDYRLGQVEIGDIIYPVISEGKYTHVLSERIKPAFERPCILFLDEPNRGDKSVQQAVFQLILDREYHGFKLHPDTYVISAANTDLEIYMVTELDPAFVTRFSVVDFEPSVNEWIEWGRETGKVSEEIISFIQANPTYADSPKEKNFNFQNPHSNRRSWTKLSTILEGQRNKQTQAINLDRKMMHAICSSFVGGSIAEQFCIHLESWKPDMSKRRTASEQMQNIEVFTNQIFTFDDFDIKTRVEKLTIEEQHLVGTLLIERFTNNKQLFERTAKKFEVIFTALNKEVCSKIWNGFNQKVRYNLKQQNSKFWDQLESEFSRNVVK